MTETPTVERDSLGSLAKALAAFQSEMPTVPKTKTADTGTYRYKYADLADCTMAAMPLLAKHGLAFTCLPGTTGLRGVLMHESGEQVTATLPINGTTPQQVGSSLTYMRRYLLGCMTGLVTDDDDDGRQAEAAPKRQPRKAPETRRPPVAPPIATEDNPAPDGSVDVPLPDVVPKDAAPQVRKAMHAGLAEVMPANLEREDRLEILAAIVGRGPLESSNDLTRDEVYRVLGFVERAKTGTAGIVRREGAWQAVAYPDEGGPG